jgi:hypothetical protein
MTTQPDGGTAFPTRLLEDFYGPTKNVWTEGMSLRDWFAGQAVVAGLGCQLTRGEGWQEAARDAYIFADALLKEREGG